MDSIWDKFSIEKFAAFLDNNLSPNEENEMNSIIQKSSTLGEILSTSQAIDSEVQLSSIDCMSLPKEIELLSNQDLTGLLDSNEADAFSLWDDTPLFGQDLQIMNFEDLAKDNDNGNEDSELDAGGACFQNDNDF